MDFDDVVAIFKFKCGNGVEAEVVKFRSESDVTGYVDASISLEALEGLKKKLATRIAACGANEIEFNRIKRNDSSS